MRRQAGFTLIELLIVVAIIGLLAAIAVPNLLNAIDRTKQKRTMTDMRIVGVAVEEYSIDKNFYPVQTTQGETSALAPLLTPAYASPLPDTDGWGFSLKYGTPPGGTAYTIRSFGKDGVKNGVGGPTKDFDCDILFQGGQFTAHPVGLQT